MERLEHTDSPQLKRRESLLSKKRRMSAIRSQQSDKSRWKRETYIPPPFNSHFENETNLPPAHKVDLFVLKPLLSSFSSSAIDQSQTNCRVGSTKQKRETERKKNSLDVSKYGMGRMYTRWVNIMHDGFGDWLRIPVIIARGSQVCHRLHPNPRQRSKHKEDQRTDQRTGRTRHGIDSGRSWKRTQRCSLYSSIDARCRCQQTQGHNGRRSRRQQHRIFHLSAHLS